MIIFLYILVLYKYWCLLWVFLINILLCYFDFFVFCFWCGGFMPCIVNIVQAYGFDSINCNKSSPQSLYRGCLRLRCLFLFQCKHLFWSGQLVVTASLSWRRAQGLDDGLCRSDNVPVLPCPLLPFCFARLSTSPTIVSLNATVRENPLENCL